MLMARRTGQYPEWFLAKLKKELPACDREILARPEVARIAAENAVQALSSGEMAREMVLLRTGWGFAVSDLSAPTVLWHGELDRNAIRPRPPAGGCAA